MQQYVLGFLFNKSLRKLVLIKKLTPIWQKGFLNGVGGKIQKNENFYEAMTREFEEETGLHFSAWVRYVELGREENGESDYKVHCFFGVYDGDEIPVHSTTEEQVKVVTINSFSGNPCTFMDMEACIPNLSWLIPLALDKIKRYSFNIKTIN